MSDAQGAPQEEVRRVHVLPEDLANQIAAGEVVERPSSVVKELVENAIDAGATRVSIEIRGGGTELVRVADDGSGMGREDARVSVLRHATSKIAELDDLGRIESFGFRGEALPSIASVSRFALRTRRKQDDEGTEVRIEGGAPPLVAPFGCAAGTIVEVADLFFNVPARRKFLRGKAGESARITEVALAAALGAPWVTVVLSREGKVAAEWLRAQSREERAFAAHKGEPLTACRGERGPLSVEAFLSRPERARNGAAGLSILVNGRPVHDRQLARAVANAYGSVLEPGRYPLGVVYLDLPHELVDVNVHPQKAEVRFADGRAVSDALTRVLAGELARAFGITPPEGGGWQRKPKLFDEATGGAAPAWSWSSEAERPGSASNAAVGERAANGGAMAANGGAMAANGGAAASGGARPAGGDASAAGAQVELDPWGLASPALAPVPYPAVEPAFMAIAEAAASMAATPASAEAARPRETSFGTLRFIAQVRRTFLVCEASDGLYILDQHAAAERVTFDRLRRAFRARDVATQQLLFPIVVPVSASEAALVEEAQDEIARAGLDVRPSGPTSVAVHAIPQLLARAAPDRLVRDLLSELSRGGERAFSGAVDLALATMACHGSVRAGDAVAKEEAAALLRALDEVEFAGHCPHGRPIVMNIRWSELEHGVGRR